MSSVSNSTNIFWQECPVGKLERQKLLNQKGCVVWITGLSGSGFLLNSLPYYFSIFIGTLDKYHAHDKYNLLCLYSMFYVHMKFVVFL